MAAAPPISARPLIWRGCRDRVDHRRRRCANFRRAKPRRAPRRERASWTRAQACVRLGTNPLKVRFLSDVVLKGLCLSGASRDEAARVFRCNGHPASLPWLGLARRRRAPYSGASYVIGAGAPWRSAFVSSPSMLATPTRPSTWSLPQLIQALRGLDYALL